MDKKEQNETSNDTMLDKLVWKILTPILTPINFLIDLFSPSYKLTKVVFKNNDSCYCGSRRNYSNCCLMKNRQKSKIAIKIIKDYLDSDRQEIKVKVVNDEKSILKKFTPGTINPLNKNGSFVDTSGYDSE